jgi:hypothetical protein
VFLEHPGALWETFQGQNQPLAGVCMAVELRGHELLRSCELQGRGLASSLDPARKTDLQALCGWRERAFVFLSPERIQWPKEECSSMYSAGPCGLRALAQIGWRPSHTTPLHVTHASRGKLRLPQQGLEAWP